jgi:exodeoxyribonuclease VII large subunit
MVQELPEIAEDQKIGRIIYSPSVLLNLFNNAISLRQTKQVVHLRGIYIAGKGQCYNGIFYDSIRDELTDAQLSLLVPGLLREKMVPNTTIEFSGYITRRVVNNGGRIEVQVNITELLSEAERRYSEEEIESFKILQKKASIGYRDVESALKSKIIQQQVITIKILVGKGNIIEHDIKHQLEETISYYDFEFIPISMSGESEIIHAIHRLNTEDIDIVVVSRGGGDRLDIFNKPSIASAALGLAPYFVTAIGHKEDVTLLQKVADKAFITPTALGQYLNDLYNNTQAELQNSKAKMVEDIKKQLAANYEKQVLNLQQQLKSHQELALKAANDKANLYEQGANQLKKQLADLSELQSGKDRLIQQSRDLTYNLQNQLRRVQSRPRTSLAAIIIAVVIGLIIGAILSGKH